MHVEWKEPGDATALAALVSGASDAKQRDRYRVVLLAGRGLGDRAELTREQIADGVGRSRQFVDEWVGRYRAGGVGALVPKRRPGATPELTAGQQGQLKAMLDAGPPPEEGLAAYNGPILREKIRQTFGTLYSLPGLYAMLHRLGYNDLAPRPRHPDTDPAVLDEFKKKDCPSVWLGSGPIIPTNAS
jgi:transposase